MTEPKENIYLHLSDLKLLMENYQNVVQLNTILLEQQKQIVDLQKEVVKNQENISKNQTDIYEKINAILPSGFKETNENIESSYKSLDSAMHGRFDATVIKVENTKSAVDTVKLDMVKQHSGITNKLYVALVGSAVIIISLLSLLITTYEKFKIMDNVHIMINKIMVFFKII